MDDDDFDWEAAAQVAEAEAVKYEKAHEALANVRDRLSQQDANESQEESAPDAALESEQPSDYRVEFLEGVGVPRPAALGAFEVLAKPLALAGFDGDAGLCVLCALAVELGESDQASLHRLCEARPDDVVSLCRVHRAGTTNALDEKVKFVVNDWRFLNGLRSPPRVAAPPPAASSPKLAAVFRSPKPPVAVRSPKPAAAPSPKPPVAVRSPKPAAAPSPKPQAARSPKPAVRSPQPPQVQSSIPTFFTKKPLDVEKKRPRDIAESELCAGFGPKDLDDGSASDSDGESEGFGAVELSENVLQSQGCPDFDDEARRDEELDGEEGCDTSEPECQLPLTGFAVQEEEQIARSAAAVTATLQNLHIAASTRKLTSQLTAPWRLMYFHHRLSARAAEIVRQTQFLPPTKQQFDFLDNDALVREIKAMPDLNVDILLERVDVIEIPEGCWREVQKFADQLEGKRLTKSLVENMSMRLIRESTLVVCADRRGRQKALGRGDVPDVSAVCLFISNADCFQNLMFEAFGPPPPKSTPARQLVFRQLEGAAKFTKPLRAKNEGHEGDMYGVGVRKMRKGLNKDASRSDYHTYCHADGWKKDVAYVNAVPNNFAKVCALEKLFSPKLSRFRLETRKRVGLPGLHHRFGDRITAPAMVISKSYMSPMHKDRTAQCFPESIVWVRGKKRVDWHFAVPAAGCAFDLREASPCFCLLQASDTVHGTLHTDKHDGVGFAILTRDNLTDDDARLAAHGEDVAKRARH